MFNNISGKIKHLAKVECWVGIIACVIIGGVLIYEGEEGVGAIVIIVGSAVAWVMSWFLYGFGELIEKTTEIATNTAKGSLQTTATADMNINEKLVQIASWRENGLISETEYEEKKQALQKGESYDKR